MNEKWEKNREEENEALITKTTTTTTKIFFTWRWNEKKMNEWYLEIIKKKWRLQKI